MLQPCNKNTITATEIHHYGRLPYALKTTVYSLYFARIVSFFDRRPRWSPNGTEPSFEALPHNFQKQARFENWLQKFGILSP